MTARLEEHRSAGEKLAERLRKQRSELLANVHEIERALEELGFPLPPAEALAPPHRTRKATHAPVQDALTQALASGPLKAPAIAEKLGRTIPQVRSLLKDKLGSGVVRRVGPGLYGLPEPAPTTPTE